MKNLLTPFQRFFKIEASSGIILFATALLAIIIANGNYKDFYFSLHDIKIGFTFAGFSLYKPLILWVNDALMALFFFIIGLEIKREVLAGEFNNMQKAILPILGAIGGMVVPIAIFVLLNKSPETAKGWAIPMATDIAFSLGILALLGSRVNRGLKTFLTAFAIVDDIGAIVIIAIFYSTGIAWTYLLIAMGIYLVLLALNKFQQYNRYVFFTLSVIIWFLFLKSGIHPTIAGVLLAFAIPAKPKVNEKEFHNLMGAEIKNFYDSRNDIITLSKKQLESIDHMEDIVHAVQPRYQHLEHRLHSLVAFVVMPIFAFMNAGIDLSSSFSGQSGLPWLSVQIALALIFGNFIGISVMVWLGRKFKIAGLPEGTNYKQFVSLSFLGGFGFTMSIFIATLAFDDQILLEQAKIGIIAGSLISGIVGYVLLKTVLKK